MTDEQFIEKFGDLVYEYIHTKGDTLMYGETIETPKGTFDVEVNIIEYNNE